MPEPSLILYNPPSCDPRRATLPASLLALGAVLEGRVRYEIVDGNLLASPESDLLRIVCARPITALAMTVMPGPQLCHSVPLVRRIKAERPDLPVIWGGYFPTQHGDVALASGWVDYVVRGQGELTLVELLSALEGRGDLASIAGLSYRAGGAIRRNPPRSITPLDALPPLPFHRVTVEQYIHGNHLGARAIAYNSSFGCPFACSFCAIVSMTNRRWVAESAERTAAALSWLRSRHGVDAVQFLDMDFFISRPRVEEFCGRVKGTGTSWWAMGRIDELSRYSDSMWRLLAASGLKMVFCGAETGSDDTLGRMNKGGRAETALALELAARVKEFGIVPEYSFVLGNPPEPEHDLEQTLAFIRKVKEVNPATELILYSYTPVVIDGVRGELSDDARRAGFSFPATLEEWIDPPWRGFAYRRDPQTPWSRPSLRRRIRDFERVLNAYYPTTTDPALTPLRRALLRGLSGWRYRLGVYRHPVELRVAQKLFAYQRPETAGF